MLAMMSGTAAAQTVNESVTFDEKIHDFGTISETGGKVKHRFTFTNTGRDTVALTSARAGCSCVHAEVSKRPVYPGKKGYVDVTFDPNFRPGHFSKEIVVFSNAQKKFNRIWVKGDVTPGKHPIHELYNYDYGHGLFMNYRRMVMLPVAPGHPQSMKLKFGNDGTSTINLTFRVDNPSNDFSVQFPTIHLLKAGDEGEANVSVRAITSFTGSHSVKVTPIANGEALSPLEIVVTGKE